METPVFEVAILKISINHFSSGVLVLWKIVPDVSETRLRQFLHLYRRCLVEISQYSVPPHSRQTNPLGQRVLYNQA